MIDRSRRKSSADCSQNRLNRVLIDLHADDAHKFLIAALKVGLVELKHWFLLTTMVYQIKKSINASINQLLQDMEYINMEMFRHNHARFIGMSMYDNRSMAMVDTKFVQVMCIVFPAMWNMPSDFSAFVVGLPYFRQFTAHETWLDRIAWRERVLSRGKSASSHVSITSYVYTTNHWTKQTESLLIHDAVSVVVKAFARLNVSMETSSAECSLHDHALRPHPHAYRIWDEMHSFVSLNSSFGLDFARLNWILVNKPWMEIWSIWGKKMSALIMIQSFSKCLVSPARSHSVTENEQTSAWTSTSLVSRELMIRLAKRGDQDCIILCHYCVCVISRLAQSVERQTLNLAAKGSSPLLGGKYFCLFIYANLIRLASGSRRRLNR